MYTHRCDWYISRSDTLMAADDLRHPVIDELHCVYNVNFVYTVYIICIILVRHSL